MSEPATDPWSDRLSTRVEITLDAPAGPPADAPQRRFVYEVARRAGVTSWAEAQTTARGALSAFGEWLEPPRRRDVAACLPRELGHAVARPARATARHGDVVTLYQRAIARQRAQCSLHESAVRCAAVLAVLAETLPDPLAAQLTDELPESIVPLLAVPRPDLRHR